MSFDVFMQWFPPEAEPETARRQVREVLQRQAHSGPDEFGFFVIDFPDGCSLEFSAKGLAGPGDFTGCAFHIRGMSPLLVRFMFEVAKAGQFVILPAMEPFVPILTAAHQRDKLPPDLLQDCPEPVVCQSADELAALLGEGYTSWKRYRDQVVGPPGVSGGN
jgi:hypothetical protein